MNCILSCFLLLSDTEIDLAAQEIINEITVPEFRIIPLPDFALKELEKDIEKAESDAGASSWAFNAERWNDEKRVGTLLNSTNKFSLEQFKQKIRVQQKNAPL